MTGVTTSLPSSRGLVVLRLVLVVFAMLNDIVQSEYSQWAFGDLSFNSYFFLTYFTTIFLSLTLPVLLLARALAAKCAPASNESVSDARGWWERAIAYHQTELAAAAPSPAPAPALSLNSVSSGEPSPAAASSLSVQLLPDPDGLATAPSAQLTFRQYALYSTVLMIFNFSSTYLWYMSLGLISVAVNFAISHCELIVVIVLSRIFLNERFGRPQLLTLAVLVLGLVMVGWHKSSVYNGGGTSQAGGILIVIAATVLWGFYEVLYKKWFGTPNVYQLCFVQSLMGIECLAIGGVVLAIVWSAGAEPVISFAGDTSATGVMAFCWFSAAFGVSYFVSYAGALTCATPVWMSFVGLCSIPLTAIADHLCWGKAFPPLTIAGMAVILTGLVCYNGWIIKFPDSAATESNAQLELKSKSKFDESAAFGSVESTPNSATLKAGGDI